MEIHEKYGISKEMGIGMLAQIILISAGLVLTVMAIASSTEWNRTVIYIGQSLVCVIILIFGFVHFKERGMKAFKALVNAYALFEALRLALISMEGVSPLVAALAKFILAVIVANCALLAERLENDNARYTARFLIALEAVLYIIFLVGGASLVAEEIDRYVPITGLLIAGSIALFLRAKKEQLAHPDYAGSESALAHKMSNRIDEELKKAGVAFGDEDMNGVPDQFEKTEEDRRKYEEEHRVNR